MSDSVSGEAASARRRVLAGVGLALVAAVIALIVTDPFGGSTKPGGGVGDNATTTSLATVTRRSLSSQTQVSGTLGYAGSSSIRVPSGTAPSAVSQAQQSVTNAQGMLSTASASLTADSETLAGHQATVSAVRAKEAVDCAGDGAAESASSGSPSSGGGGLCASDVQAVSAAEQSSSGASMKIKDDRAQVSSAEKSLASAESSLSAARSSGALYGQSSTFTKLPPVGQVFTRGQSLYEISGQSVVLLYGSVLPTRAFIAGMSAGSDVGELNANLDALGYGEGLTGDTFSAATGAAIRAFQSAHGLTVTGELLLGSVVFEPGAVRVTSVTATVGATVMPGPVLGISSTARQVKLALDAAQQASVKKGDGVTITLPDNQTTPGRIAYVSSVATSPSSKAGEEESGPTIEVDATPTDPAATGRLDQAPVNVSITTESVRDALAVPIDALLALAGGGYSVEVAEGRVHRLEAVSLGLFDDADGLVQLSGQGVSAGQRVVVSGT
ncbi:MAG TPA: peptidoglycan-binding protein [Solirubrobacteraceae bacterium]|jgi:peptidoglycan hydrolase-like protein with peptidoglycan-binding domain